MYIYFYIYNLINIYSLIYICMHFVCMCICKCIGMPKTNAPESVIPAIPAIQVTSKLFDARCRVASASLDVTSRFTHKVCIIPNVGC